jgi:hypothetical protein
MQKVEGSNPFSRFRKGLHLQAFCMCTVGWWVLRRRVAIGYPVGEFVVRVPQTGSFA